MALGKKKQPKSDTTARQAAPRTPAGQSAVGTSLDSGRGLSFFEDFDQLFEDFLQRRWPAPSPGSWPGPGVFWPGTRGSSDERLPLVDVADEDAEIVVRAELPGVAKEDLDVSVVDRVLTIRATSRQKHEDRKKDYYRREIRTGQFSRSVLLPAEVDADKAQASFSDGVMNLRLPKISQSRRRKIRFGD